MSEITPQALLSRIVAEFERQGWRGGGEVALRVVKMVETDEDLPLERLAGVAPRTFLVKNGTKRAEVHDSLARALAGVRLRRPRPPLISIDAIDSFKAVTSVDPRDVADLAAAKLPIPEEKVKEYISRIIGEPYIEKDWGGELSDIATTRVELGGNRVPAAFLLKGQAAPMNLRPRHLGANADQIRRLSKVEADLYVVQHVGSIDVAVRDMLRDMVVARRAEGRESAVGSAWDGADCARLFVAHELIHPTTGKPLS